MGYKEEAIECVKDHVLPLHKQIYAKYDGDFDRIYSEGYNSKSYQGRVIEPGKVYELSYSECSCPKVKCGLRSNPEQCLEQREPPNLFNASVPGKAFYIFCRSLNLTASSMSGLRIRFSGEVIVVLSG